MNPAIEVRGVHKRYGGVHALRDVSCSVEAGEVRAIVGENGSGKSTLVRVIAGAVRQDEGSVYADGQPLAAGDLAARRRAGVDVVGQDAELCRSFTVAENVYMGRWITRRGLLARDAMVRTTQEVLDREDLPLCADAPARSLSQDLAHLVEVARVAVHAAKVVAFDETTASLTADHVERLAAFIRRLRDRGAAVLLVTHRLNEVFGLCDSVTVLRDGAHVATAPVADLDEASVVRMMVGRELSLGYSRRSAATGPCRLRIRNLALRPDRPALDLDVHAGEVVGLAGLVGSGRSATLESVYGMRPRLSGEVRCDAALVPPGRPDQAIRLGLGLVPEDRRRQGLSMDQSVVQNASLLHPVRHGLLRPVRASRGERSYRLLTEQIGLKAPGRHAKVATLSGGNQQKVVLGRLLEDPPAVLLLDEPTRGIDVGAKREIYELVDRLAKAGTAILLATSELPELLALSDRIRVLRDGGFTDEFGPAASEHDVGMALLGATANPLSTKEID